MVVREAADVFRHLRSRLQGMTQEVFIVLALDARNGILDEIEVARGSLTGVDVHPREVFRPLIRLAAAAAVVAHNHPSGDPRPSPDDVALTRRLRASGEILGIPILDHVVVGGDGFTSVGETVGIECELGEGVSSPGERIECELVECDVIDLDVGDPDPGEHPPPLDEDEDREDGG